MRKINENLPSGFKRCCYCNEVKPFEMFNKSNHEKSGYKPRCKECRKATEYEPFKEHIKKKSKLRYETNKADIYISNKLYREKNKDWYKNYNEKYYQENKTKIKDKSKRYIYARLENDLGFRIQARLRKRINSVMNGISKSKRTMELVGCSHDELIKHIESQFKEGMNWENYGEWHIDHIIPCALFDFTKESDQLICFNYKNLQPLWAKENISKGKKLLPIYLRKAGVDIGTF